jgi:hypothetical protein
MMTAEERQKKDRARWNAYDALHREERRAKDRADYAANPDRHRAKNRAYHAARRDPIIGRQRKRRTEKRDADLARKAAYRQAHPDLIKQQTRAQYYSVPADERRIKNRAWNAKYTDNRRAWREQNRERLAEQSAEWARTHRAHKQAARTKRRADEIRATPSWADLRAILAVYEESARLTRETCIKHEVDHIVPLRSSVVCGLHVAHNLQVLTKTENCRKCNKLIAA